jgi:clan AA aspartic protease (TIGR02281 family)
VWKSQRTILTITGLAFSIWLAWEWTGLVQATMYRCLDAAGAHVFTDSSAQLNGCIPIAGRNASESSSVSQSSPVTPLPLAHETHTDQVSPPAGMAPDQVPAGISSEVMVPIQRAGNLLVVQVQLNGGRETKLILDTGASHTILSSAVARDLGILGGRQATSVTLKTAGGPVQADMVQVDSIRVGEAEVRNSQAAIYDVPDTPAGVDGLLGLTFLHQFAFTLDMPNSQLHLRRRN